MAQGGVPPYPSVFVVDSHTAYPPVPPRPSPPRRGIGVAQTLLILLVSLALCGMAIEACFIYRLYHPDPGPSAQRVYNTSVASTVDLAFPPKDPPSPLWNPQKWAESLSASKSIQDKEDTTPPPTKRPNPVILPSKPVAHLTYGQDVVHGDQIMSWSMEAQPLLYEMEYKEGKLVIQKEGYYYIYSKVFFKENVTFHHSVCRTSPRYLGKDIPLLVSRRYSQKSDKNQLNSYLGGVFHLFKGDGIFVKIINIKQIVRHSANENFFGAYMI